MAYGASRVQGVELGAETKEVQCRAAQGVYVMGEVALGEEES